MYVSIVFWSKYWPTSDLYTMSVCIAHALHEYEESRVVQRDHSSPCKCTWPVSHRTGPGRAAIRTASAIKDHSGHLRLIIGHATAGRWPKSIFGCPSKSRSSVLYL